MTTYRFPVRFSSSLLLTFFSLTLLLTAFCTVIGPRPALAADSWNAPVWQDDFSGTANTAPDPTKWGYDIGTGSNHDGWGNGELEYYTNSTKNCYQDGNGHLVIKAIKENVGTGADARSYSSCRLVSANKGDWENGRIEIRAKLPVGGTGIWPALWMLPTDTVYGVWPRSGEIDMMEMSNDPNTVYGTIHYGVPWTHIGTPYTLSNNDYHTYALEWDENEIRWYVDNVLYETRDSPEWYSSSAGRPAPFDQRFHLMMNLAVGGAWPGSPTASTAFPQEMDVDYVKVQQRPGSHPKPIPGKVQAERYSAVSGATAENTTDVGVGQDMGNMNVNSYMDYPVTVATAGTYAVEYRVASANATGKLDLSVDGTKLATIAVPNTGGWQNWQTISNFVNLPAGSHTIRVTQSGYGFNLNWLNFIPGGNRTVLNFENFDTDQYFGTYASGATITASKVTNLKTQGSYALRMDYNQVTGGVGEWFYRFYQDWHYDTGLKLDIYGQNSGRRISVGLEDTSDERFEYDLPDNFTGWKTVTIPFTSFFRSTSYQPGDAPNDGLDRQSVNAINFSVLDNGAGTLYVDNLQVYDDTGTGGGTGGAPIPGQIEAESYAAMSGVQTENTADTGSGQDVGWIDTNDWMDYHVNVQTAGTYTLQYRVASPNANTQAQLLSGATVLATTTIPNTGGWQTWQTVTATVNLSAGDQTLRVLASVGGWNLNWINFVSGSGSGGTGTTIPGKVEAESYTSHTGSVQTEATNDTGGGLNVGYINNPGDSMTYQVNVTKAGSYTVQYRIASVNATGQLQLKNGATVLATTNIPNTGSYQTWQTITATVTLSAGSQNLTVYAVSGGWNINWLNFIAN